MGARDAYHEMSQARESTVRLGPHMLASTRLLCLVLVLAVTAVVGCGEHEGAGEGPLAKVRPLTPDAQGGDVVGWIEVVATRADGKPASGATAYAVRVGRASQTAVPDWPQVELDESGHARIPVPDAGTYDVGVVYPSQEEPRALVTDVKIDSGETTRVEARLPALAAVDVTIEGAGAAPLAIYASEAGEPGSRVSYYPARGERNDTRWSFGANVDGVRLPVGVAYEIFIQEREESGRWMAMMEGWKAEPAVVLAPGQVVFRRNHPARPSIDVPVRFTVTGTVPSELRHSGLQIGYAEGTLEESELSNGLAWRGGKPEHPGVTIPGGSTPARITWRGDGVVPGELLLPGALAAGAAIPPIEIAIHADELPLVEGIDVECGRTPPRQDAPFLHATGPDSASCEAFGFYAWNEDRLADLRPGWKAVVEWGAWWVSRPVTIPTRGRLKFTLEPGGYLLATSTRVPTPGLGMLTIRRADGAWLGERTAHEIASDDCDGGNAWHACPGMILGPLPEGEVELIVSLGGEERARIVAHVTANAITTFRLTW